MRKVYRRIFDVEDKKSLSTKFRKKRFSLFLSLIEKMEKPLKILDVGGTQVFWERMNFVDVDDIEVVLFNLSREKIRYKNFSSLVGDAQNMIMFSDNEFDIVFSNSVLQYVGIDGYLDQCSMATEIQRVGKRYFVQSPNRNFPIEPHFQIPFFQFFPKNLQVFLISHFNLGFREKMRDRQKAIRTVNSIRMIKKEELHKLFPNSTIYEEKVFGITKSFIAYRGW
jgi:ubiquinone/menaquinone biosynthesis C-methylase UbiE